MYNYSFDSKFDISQEDAPRFRMIKQLLDSGESIPVLLNGVKFGAGVKCSIEDDRYWAFDFGKSEVEKSPTLSVQMQFELESVSSLEFFNIQLKSVRHTVKNDKGKPSFSLFLFFEGKLVYKPLSL